FHPLLPPARLRRTLRLDSAVSKPQHVEDLRHPAGGSGFHHPNHGQTVQESPRTRRGRTHLSAGPQTQSAPAPSARKQRAQLAAGTALGIEKGRSEENLRSAFALIYRTASPAFWKDFKSV